MSWMALQVQGDIGPLTCYTDSVGRLIAFLKAPPRVPETLNQKRNRDKFVAAGLAWRGLTSADRQCWRLACSKANLACTHFNLWVACWIRNDWSFARTISAQTGIPLTHPT